ncbi:hypothetical protein ACHAP5_009283 [Fusarium lateritium]
MAELPDQDQPMRTSDPNGLVAHRSLKLTDEDGDEDQEMDPDDPSTNMDWKSGPFTVPPKYFAPKVDWKFHETEYHYKLLWSSVEFTLKRETINAHPDFKEHFKEFGSDMVLWLIPVCSCSANILVLYLLTGTYQDIYGKCTCDNYLERISDRGFHRALRANSLAAKYDLDELSTIAKENLRKEGDEMTFEEILRLLCDIEWLQRDLGEDKDLIEFLFERAASIRPGEEDEEINLKDYMIEDPDEWSYEVMFGHVLKLRAEMQQLKRQQASKATEHGEA